MKGKKLNTALISIVLISITINFFIPIIFNFKAFNSFENSEKINSVASNQGYINTDNYEIFWFIHVSDLHVTTTDSLESFNYLLNETFMEINPLLIVNTGDLVDSNLGSSLNVNEWLKYENILNNTGMNSSVYVDLIGNHDVSLNPNYEYFLNYSITGNTYNATQISFNKSFSFGDYAFIGLDTTKNTSYNFIEFGHFGFLNTKEMDWYEGELEKYKNCDRIFVFGHHPINRSNYLLFSDLTSSGKSLIELNEEYNVFCYFCGHSHDTFFQKSNGLLHVETKNFDNDEGVYRIVAVDNNQLSTSVEEVGVWPQGIITYPPREEYIVESLGNLNKIRVLAWDPLGLESVEWCVYNQFNSRITDWKPLFNTGINNPLWEGNWPSNLNDGNNYFIKVKITGASGTVIKELNFTFQKNLFVLYIAMIFIVSTFFSVSIIFSYYVIVREIKLEKNKWR